MVMKQGFFLTKDEKRRTKDEERRTKKSSSSLISPTMQLTRGARERRDEGTRKPSAAGET